jgi:hypothetical protein
MRVPDSGMSVPWHFLIDLETCAYRLTALTRRYPSCEGPLRSRLNSTVAVTHAQCQKWTVRSDAAICAGFRSADPSAEIINRQHHAPEVVPPDPGRQVAHPYGACDEPKHSDAIIGVVPGLAIRGEDKEIRRVVWYRSGRGEIIGRGVDAPIFPIDQLDLLASAVARQKNSTDPHRRG